MTDDERDREWLDKSMAGITQEPDDPPEVRVQKQATAGVMLFAGARLAPVGKAHEYLIAARLFDGIAEYIRALAENVTVEKEIADQTIVRDEHGRVMRRCANGCGAFIVITGDASLRRDARYCSTRCRVAAHRAKQKAAEA